MAPKFLRGRAYEHILDILNNPPEDIAETHTGAFDPHATANQADNTQEGDGNPTENPESGEPPRRWPRTEGHRPRTEDDNREPAYTPSCATIAPTRTRATLTSRTPGTRTAASPDTERVAQHNDDSEHGAQDPAP